MRRKKRAIQMQFVDANQAPDEPSPMFDVDAALSAMEKVGRTLIKDVVLGTVAVIVVKTAAEIVESKLDN